MASGVGTAKRNTREAQTGEIIGGGRKASLEVLADKEIARHNFALGDVRLFTEVRLQHKALREALQAREVFLDDIPDQVLEYLFEQWVCQQLYGCRLTRFQRAIYEMHLRGLSAAEIASQIGQSRQRISTILSGARQAARSRPHDKYDGLQQVYWQEVRRYIYRKPRRGWDR